ncbi:MAG: YkgJ family cysteine cluster protein [Desulfobacterales bacterium]|nr:YkgJ family cysteine cluster protein [Desulfobacterales bacterium]
MKLEDNTDNCEINECRRCGICCKKGGPSLHKEDKYLLEQGKLLLKYIYTIRKGEPVFENVKGIITTALSDLIKIKSEKNSSTCIFYNEKIGCSIYNIRPIECKALKCWDTLEIEKIYSKDRLERKDVLKPMKDIWELVNDHQNKCSYEKLNEFFKAGRNNKQFFKNEFTIELNSEINDMINYDKNLREVISLRLEKWADKLDFLLGRPMSVVIK